MTSPSWQTVVCAAWEEGQRLGAVGPGDVQQHLVHAQQLAALVGPPPASALDLGTGCGIPGLALAGFWPETTIVLLDAAERRLRPIVTAIRTLGWDDRVQIAHGRAEHLGHDPEYRARFDLVCCRLFGPAATTAECAAPFASIGGRVLVTGSPVEPGGAGQPDARPDVPVAPDRRWIGLDDTTLGLVVGTSVRSPIAAQWLDKVADTPSTYPRRDGVPRKRPLFGA